MRKLVTIDLSSADTSAFEDYERRVVPLLSQYGGQLELSVRSVDGKTETHVLFFPDAMRFEAFLSDPIRTALREEWQLTGATAVITDVAPVEY